MVENEIADCINKASPDLIGIGGICIDYKFIKDAMEVIRKHCKIPIVLGGGIVNNDAEFIFNLLKPDYAIQGEGEEAIVKLANKEESPNTWYWKDGKAVYTGKDYNYRPLDKRPLPDYEPFGIMDMLDNHSHETRQLYRYSRPNPRPMVIVTARQCPFNCSFCIHRGSPKYRVRSIENIVKEIKENYEKYKFNILIIVDELFAVNKKYMDEFSRTVIQGRKDYGWDFDWMFQTHANAKLDLESLKLAKEAGCYFFSYGLESASPTVLKSMNKKTKVPQIIEAIKLAGEAKIGFGGNLIFGDPAETEATINETLDFYFQYCREAFVFLGFLMPYPGSQLFDYCWTNKIIKDKVQYYENIDRALFNMTTMPNSAWQGWIHYIDHLERGWMNVERTDAEWFESNGSFKRFGAKCPFCGEDIVYREKMGTIPPLKQRLYLGVGCTKCNKKIRVDIDGTKVKERSEIIN
jgi:anaerobic magnesium-protoporphyrin IX monomethyl ester cyclase